MPTSNASPFSKRKQIRHCRLIRMEYSPDLAPLNFSSLFDGGAVKSETVSALSIIIMLTNARIWISGGIFFDRLCPYICSVSLSLNDRITLILYAIQIYLQSRYILVSDSLVNYALV